MIYGLGTSHKATEERVEKVNIKKIPPFRRRNILARLHHELMFVKHFMLIDGKAECERNENSSGAVKARIKINPALRLFIN